MIIGEAKSRDEAEANAEKTYQKMDKNEDGTVNASEFLELIESGGHEITDAVKKDVDEMITLIDTDSDGKMTLEEFKTAFGTVYEKLNGSDNKVTHKEGEGAKQDAEDDDIIAKIMGAAKNRKEAEENSLKAFEQVDVNDDGKVTTEELLTLASDSEKADPNIKQAAE